MKGLFKFTGNVFENTINYEAAELIKGECEFRKKSKNNKIVISEGFRSNDLKISIQGNGNNIFLGKIQNFRDSFWLSEIT